MLQEFWLLKFVLLFMIPPAACATFAGFIQNENVAVLPILASSTGASTIVIWSSVPSNVAAPLSFPVALNAGHAVPEQVPLFPWLLLSWKWEPLYSPWESLLRWRRSASPVVLNVSLRIWPLATQGPAKATEFHA